MTRYVRRRARNCGFGVWACLLKLGTPGILMARFVSLCLCLWRCLSVSAVSPLLSLSPCPPMSLSLCVRVCVYPQDIHSCIHTSKLECTCYHACISHACIQSHFLGFQVAGYTVQFPGMRFSTVHGAGHMVPSTRPQQAFDMFEKFLDKKPW